MAKTNNRKHREYVFLHRSKVYIVIEHPIDSDDDAIIHGVYTTRECANEKRKKITNKGTCGYIGVIQKTIKGPHVLTIVKE